MNFFLHFPGEKASLPLPAGRLSCLYIQWVAYKYAICKECLWIKSLFAPKFRVYRGKTKGSEIVLRLILPEKNDSPRKQYPSFPLVWLKSCCLPGIFRKHTKFVTVFVQKIDENAAIFSNLERCEQLKLVHAFYKNV